MSDRPFEVLAERAVRNARMLAAVELVAAKALDRAAEITRDEPTSRRRRAAAARAREIAERQEYLARWFETPPSRRGPPPSILSDPATEATGS